MELDFSGLKEKVKWSFNGDFIKRAFDEQYELFFDIKNRGVKNPIKTDFSFSKNTLIHGTSFDRKKLQSIKQTGILSGDFVGVEEKFDESEFCADFFRLDRELSLFKFFAEMNGTRDWVSDKFMPIKPLGQKPTANEFIDVSNCRLPFLKSDQSKNNVAFVIDGENEQLLQLQNYDYYRHPYEIMKSIVSEKRTRCFYHPEMSSILFGVPYNLVSAVVVGMEVEMDSEKLDFIKETFSNLPIISSSGKILYIPEDRQKVYDVQAIENQFNRELADFLGSNKDLNYKPSSTFVDRILKEHTNQLVVDEGIEK